MSLLLLDPPARAPPSPVSARDYVSYSALKTYQQCPLRYFFRYIAGLPEESISASLLFGTSIHRAVEHHFQRLLAGETPPSLEELLAEYRAGWDERQLPVRFGSGEQEQTFEPMAAKMLAAFVRSDLTQPEGRILAVEETLRGPLLPGLPDLLGRIDLILETADQLVVRDWKTARAKYSAEQVDDAAPQLLLYGELARDLAPGKRVVLEIVVLTKTKEPAVERYPFPWDAGRLARTQNVLQRVWAAIEDGHFYPAPSPMNCPGCPYKAPCQKWPA